MGAAAQDIFEVDRCDPAEILAVLDEVEAQSIITNIKLAPVSGNQTEQMDVNVTPRMKFGGSEKGVDVLLKIEDTRDRFIICSDSKGAALLKILE